MLTIETKITKKGGLCPALCKDGLVISYDRDLICEILGLSHTALYMLYAGDTEASVLAEYHRKGE